MALISEGENRWVFLGKRFGVMFAAVFIVVAIGGDFKTAMTIALLSATPVSVGIAIFVALDDAGNKRMALWRWPTPSNAAFSPSTKSRVKFETEFDWEAQKQQLLERKDWRGLVQLASQWAAAQPGSFLAFCTLGLAHGQLREHEPALDAFRAALRIDSHDAGAWYNLGVAHEKLEEYPKAYMAYQHAVNKDPAYRDAARRLRAMYERIGSQEQGPKGSEKKQGADIEQGSSSQKWYVILGVSEDASADNVKAAYRKLMNDYHPDKVASLGLELRKLADEKTKEITIAFREFEQIRADSEVE